MHFLSIPTPVSAILETFQRHGFAAYLVGGCVRDGLLGKMPHDWDICTAALPEQTLLLFPDAITTGLRHGTVTVRSGGISVEVTTFRSEGAYSDHRHPDSVWFVSDLTADLARRDFTVNAMALSASGVLQDPFGGRGDLSAGMLRAVGDPERRFQEDALRMLRAVRFSAQLGFRIEQETETAIRMCAPLTEALAAGAGRAGKNAALPQPAIARHDAWNGLAAAAYFQGNFGALERALGGSAGAAAALDGTCTAAGRGGRSIISACLAASGQQNRAGLP